MAGSSDYYALLGVEKTASAEEIKKAYRKKALEFHPDRNKAADAEAKFKEVNKAYEVLSDAQKRAQYDQFGPAAFDQNAGFGGAGGFGGFSGRSGPFSYSYTTGAQNAGFDFSDPFEIFESFFGGGNPFSQAQAKPRYVLKLDFMEAVKGAKRDLVHQGKAYTVDIPAGANDGTRIRYSSFDVLIQVSDHPQFKREGYDLIVDQELSVSLAALGGTLEVPSLEKPIKLKIKAGTQPNTVMRIRGQGIKHIRSNAHGDLYVRLNIAIPKSLSREQKRLFQELAKTER